MFTTACFLFIASYIYNRASFSLTLNFCEKGLIFFKHVKRLRANVLLLTIVLDNLHKLEYSLIEFRYKLTLTNGT